MNYVHQDEPVKSASPKPVIAYLAQGFPSLTLTFVYREIMALRQMGLNVATFSIWKPQENEISAEARPLFDTTFYIFPAAWSRFLRAHTYYLSQRPTKYLNTFFHMLTRPGMKFSHRRRTFFHFLYAVYLAAEIERRGIWHIHAHFALNAATVAMVIARLLGITYSLTAHANDIFDDPVLLKEKLENAKFVITISEYNKQYLQQFVSADKIHIVHCSLDLGQFKPLSRRTNEDIPVILAIGRLVEKKGFVYLIRACQILAERGYNFKCHIVGDGPQRALLEHLITESNLADKVTLEGVVLQEHLTEYWQKTTVFALPCVVAQDQDRDGIPVALMEAMALQIPSVSTTISGIPELIEHGHSGLLAPPGDAEALANSIGQFFDNVALRESLGRNGRIKVEQDFELTSNARRLFNLFTQP